MTPRHRSDQFAARGGLALRRRCWWGTDDGAVVAIVHGLAEHGARYELAAQWLAARGHRVYVYDQRGHGESEGPRTHAPSFDVLLDDLERFLSSIHAEVGDRSLFLLGHSMGALEVISLLGSRRPRVSGAVCSGAPLLVGVGRARLRLAGVLSKLAPRMRIPAGIDPASLSRDVAVQRAYRLDPAIPKTLTARLAAELFGAVGRALDLAPKVEVPLLLLHGEADELCAAEGSRRFHERVEPGRSALRIYAGLRHEILNEPEREKVLGDAEAWIRAVER